MEDRLPHRVRDGVRYERELIHGKRIKAKIASKRAANKDQDEATELVKRAKMTYMVNPHKYAATATEEQLARELTMKDLGVEETHQILQCKIR